MASASAEQNPGSVPANGRAASEPPVCPFCGGELGNSAVCAHCGGRQDPLSRQATQNGMGPWFVRDERAPFRPGCSFETLAKMVASGAVTADSVVRGPSTHQFWVRATRAAGVARLLGICHACGGSVRTDEYLCRGCGAALEVELDRQHLGLGQTRAIPGRAGPAGAVSAVMNSPAAPDEPVEVGRVPAPAPAPAPAPTPADAANPRHEGVHAARAAKLERAIRHERRLRAMLVSLCVVLVALLVVVVATRQRGTAVPQDANAEADRAAAETAAGSAPAVAAPGTVERPTTPELEQGEPIEVDAAWLEIEREILDPDTTHDETWLDAQIERLEAMAERGELPERGERLLEALRSERERLDLRVLP